jgi:hypothetical protein
LATPWFARLLLGRLKEKGELMLQALASAERLIKTTAKDVQTKVAGSGWGAGG